MYLKLIFWCYFYPPMFFAYDWVLTEYSGLYNVLLSGHTKSYQTIPLAYVFNNSVFILMF